MSSWQPTASYSPERTRKFGRVASIFRRRYDQSRATGDLKTRIILRYVALNLTSDEDPRKADRYAVLPSIQYKEYAFAPGSHHLENRQRLCKVIGEDFTTLYQMTEHLP